MRIVNVAKNCCTLHEKSEKLIKKDLKIEEKNKKNCVNNPSKLIKDHWKMTNKTEKIKYA